MTKPVCDYLIEGHYLQERTCNEPAICAFVTPAMGGVVHYACCDFHKPKSAFIYKKYSLEEIEVMEVMNS
ncbi:MAG: hypothetical protein WC708_00040 [Lentisphaeria bacterium]|jgi:hypothetical protein